MLAAMCHLSFISHNWSYYNSVRWTECFNNAIDDIINREFDCELQFRLYYRTGKNYKKSRSHDTCRPIVFACPATTITSSALLSKLLESSFCADLPDKEDTVFDLHPVLCSCCMM